MKTDTMILERGGATRLMYCAIGLFFALSAVVFLSMGSADARGVAESKLTKSELVVFTPKVEEAAYVTNNDLLEWSLSRKRAE